MTETVTALNTLSGRVAVVNKSALSHPVFSEYLVEVEEGTKSFEPDLYKAKTADEYRESLKSRSTAKKDDKKDATD